MKLSDKSLQVLPYIQDANYNFNEQYRLFENIISSRNINQPIATSLDSLTRVNQKIINPYKTGIGFKMLSEYLDKDIIDESIKEYFITNNFMIIVVFFKSKCSCGGSGAVAEKPSGPPDHWTH